MAKTEKEIMLCSKSFLREYLNHKRNIERLNLIIDEISEGIDGLKAQRLTGMPSSHSSIDFKTVEIQKRIELEDKLRKEIESEIRSLEKISGVIKSVGDSREVMLLAYRYIKGYKWEDIAFKMGYTWQHIHKLHRKALFSVYEKLR